MAVTFTATGNSFAPVYAVAEGSAAVITTSCPGFADQTGLAPSFDFGSAAVRTVTMTVSGGGGDADVTMINLGFDPAVDAGDFMPPEEWAKSPQAVTAVGNLNSLTNLVHFLADRTTLGGLLDLTGMGALQYLQCYATDITGVTLTGCTSMVRLQVEACRLTALDLNAVAACLRDLRAAAQQGGVLTFADQLAPLLLLYHYCTRDEKTVNSIPLSMMPALRQYWTWAAELGNVLGPTSSEIREVRSYENRYTSTDISDSPLLNLLDLHNCWLTGPQVDDILETLAAGAVTGGYVDLTINTAPSATGLAAAAALEGRGWDVLVDEPADGISIDQIAAGLADSFAAPPAPGHSVVLIVTAANVDGGDISTTAPLWNFRPATSATRLLERLVKSGGTACYLAVWLIPHCGTGGANGFGLTLTGGFEIAARAFDVAGLGVLPVVDAQASASDPTSTDVDSGPAGPTLADIGIGFGIGQVFAGADAPEGDWDEHAGGSFGWIGTQIISVDGTLRWRQAAHGSGPWTAAVLTLAPFLPEPVAPPAIPGVLTASLRSSSTLTATTRP